MNLWPLLAFLRVYAAFVITVWYTYTCSCYRLALLILVLEDNGIYPCPVISIFVASVIHSHEGVLRGSTSLKAPTKKSGEG